jgi:hypothetical protein
MPCTHRLAIVFRERDNIRDYPSNGFDLRTAVFFVSVGGRGGHCGQASGLTHG